jgi:hypothetical protein
VRIESLDRCETPEGRGELLQLADRLRAEGLDVEVADRDEPTRALLREDAFHDTVAVLNIILIETEHVLVTREILKGTVKSWARARRHFGKREDATPGADLWTPDDEVLMRILLRAGEGGRRLARMALRLALRRRHDPFASPPAWGAQSYW